MDGSAVREKQSIRMHRFMKDTGRAEAEIGYGVYETMFERYEGNWDSGNRSGEGIQFMAVELFMTACGRTMSQKATAPIQQPMAILSRLYK